MKFKTLLSVIGSIAVMFGVVTTSTAATVTWTLADATLEDTVTGDLSYAYGSFYYDTVTGPYDPAITLSTDLIFNFTEFNPMYPPAGTTGFTFKMAGAADDGSTLDMYFDNPLPAAGGTVDVTIYGNILADGGSELMCIDGCFITGVPEVPVPAAVWLFGSGLIGLIGVARRKRS